MFIKILNLEKNKYFFNIVEKNIFKNIKIYIKNEGCYNYKYFFYKSKKINKFNFLLKFKNSLIYFKDYLYNYFYKLYIKYDKKKYLIKNKSIKKLCSCNYSFKF